MTVDGRKLNSQRVADAGPGGGPGLRRVIGPLLLAVAALVYLVAITFFPVLGFEFSDMDVPDMVIDNEHIRGLTAENLQYIFTSWCVTSYYPVRTTSFAIDYQLWGLEAGGFKLTSAVIHLTNVLLVFWLVLRLFRWQAGAGHPVSPWWEAAVAAFSAAVFAIHPVVVEPVVWLAAREELLATLGALGCMHFYIQARRLSERGGKRGWIIACHTGAVFWCAVACFSSAIAVVVPMLVTAWDVLTLGRPKLWRIVRATALLWVLGAVTLTLKSAAPSHDLVWGDPGSHRGIVEEMVGREQTLERSSPSSAEQIMVTVQLYWLNLKLLAWPSRLGLIYWRVTPKSFLDPGVMLGIVALGLTCAGLWVVRGKKPLLFGLIWFGLALGPALQQIFPNPMVPADRLLYLPLAGLALALGMVLRPLGKWLKGPAAVAGVVAAGALALSLLDTLSIRQVQTWQDSLSIWQNSVDADPANIAARRYLTMDLMQRGQTAEAMEHAAILWRTTPGSVTALGELALAMATSEKEELRDYPAAIRLATLACELNRGSDPKSLGILATVYGSFAESLADRGELGPAIDNYHKALEANPQHLPVLFQLADLLATCRDEKLRNPQEAVELAERGCGLTDPPEPMGLLILSTAYAEAGQLDKAVATAEQAIELAEAAGGNEALVGKLQRRLKLYRAPIPPSRR